MKAVLGKGNRAQRQKRKTEPDTFENFPVFAPEAGRGWGWGGTWDEEWAGPGTVTSRCWYFNLKQVRFPGLQAIRSRVKKCLPLWGEGGCGVEVMLNQWKSSERVSRISTGSADQEPIHHQVPSMSVCAYCIFVI